MATHSSILAWRSHGQRSLAGYSPWSCKEQAHSWIYLFNLQKTSWPGLLNAQASNWPSVTFFHVLLVYISHWQVKSQCRENLGKGMDMRGMVHQGPRFHVHNIFVFLYNTVVGYYTLFCILFFFSQIFYSTFGINTYIIWDQNWLQVKL